MAMPDDRRGRETAAPAGAREEAQREAEGRAQQETDQTAADPDQTQADFDQAESDADQLASNADQRLADRDQQASDRDQVVADWEHTQTPAAALSDQAHKTSRMEREATSQERSSTAAVRSRTTAERASTAKRRDDVSRARDLTATARDHSAEARDAAADARDRAAETRERHAAETSNLDHADAPRERFAARPPETTDTRARRGGADDDVKDNAGVPARRSEGLRPPMADNIEQWDGHALKKLIERGAMTVREIMESAEIDQFTLPIAHAWVESASERGLIETGSNESTRYNITAAGRNAARGPTGRFIASEKARDGEPSSRS